MTKKRNIIQQQFNNIQKGVWRKSLKMAMAEENIWVSQMMAKDDGKGTENPQNWQTYEQAYRL